MTTNLVYDSLLTANCRTRRFRNTACTEQPVSREHPGSKRQLRGGSDTDSVPVRIAEGEIAQATVADAERAIDIDLRIREARVERITPHLPGVPAQLTRWRCGECLAY